MSESIPSNELNLLSANPQSRAWATAMHHDIRGDIIEYVLAMDSLAFNFKEFVKHEGWSRLTGLTDEPFQSLEEYCGTVGPIGLECSLDAINAIIAMWKCTKELYKPFMDNVTHEDIRTNPLRYMTRGEE